MYHSVRIGGKNPSAFGLRFFETLRWNFNEIRIKTNTFFKAGKRIRKCRLPNGNYVVSTPMSWYSPWEFQDFPAVWMAVPREAMGAHFGDLVLPNNTYFLSPERSIKVYLRRTVPFAAVNPYPDGVYTPVWSVHSKATLLPLPLECTLQPHSEYHRCTLGCHSMDLVKSLTNRNTLQHHFKCTPDGIYTTLPLL